MPEPLTDRFIKSLQPLPGARVEVSDLDCPGLRLRVLGDGSKVWSLLYRTEAGDPRRYKLGAYPGLTLTEARKLARGLAVDISRGADPQGERKGRREARRAKLEAATLTAVADAFVADQAEEWRLSTRIAWTRYLEVEVKPVLGRLPVVEVTGDQIEALVDAIKRRPAPTSARRCFEVIRRLFAWAAWKKYIPVNPCAIARPFERRKRVRGGGANKAFSDDQLRAIFRAAAGSDERGLLALVAFTAVRAHEARAARWSDIDEERALWRVPAELHKTGDITGAPHLVPLSGGALRVLAEAREANLADGWGASPWVFPARTKGCEVCGLGGHVDKPNKLTAAVKRAAGIVDRGLLHRFRDTIKTRMSEHGIAERVSEHVLGHVVPGIAGTYDHAEMLQQRREALEWWGSELERILAPAEVVSIAEHRA